MKQSILFKGAAVLAMAVLVVGCATGGSAGSDEDQIKAAVKTWEQAVLDKDVDKIMSIISENFSHDGYEYSADSKAELREFIEASIDEGNFEDVELYLDDMEINIDGNTATVYPIEWSIAAGSVTIELTLTKEKGGWMLTDMAIEGL